MPGRDDLVTFFPLEATMSINGGVPLGRQPIFGDEAQSKKEQVEKKAYASKAVRFTDPKATQNKALKDHSVNINAYMGRLAPLTKQPELKQEYLELKNVKQALDAYRHHPSVKKLNAALVAVVSAKDFLWPKIDPNDRQTYDNPRFHPMSNEYLELRKTQKDLAILPGAIVPQSKKNAQTTSASQQKTASSTTQEPKPTSTTNPPAAQGIPPRHPKTGESKPSTIDKKIDK